MKTFALVVIAIAGVSCATGASGPPTTRTVSLRGPEPVALARGPLAVTEASRSGQGKLICWAAGSDQCAKVTERGIPLFDLASDAETWKRTATVPRGMSLCCGFDGGAGGELTLTMRGD